MLCQGVSDGKAAVAYVMATWISDRCYAVVWQRDWLLCEMLWPLVKYILAYVCQSVAHVVATCDELVHRCHAKVEDGIATCDKRVVNFKFWGVKQKIIPNVWQIVFANILIKEWTIEPYVYWLFNRSTVLARFCPFPNMLKLSTVVTWPMMLQGKWITDVPWTFFQMFLKFYQ